MGFTGKTPGKELLVDACFKLLNSRALTARRSISSVALSASTAS